MRINSFISPDALKDDPVVLSAEESHHLARVLRVEVGQKLTLFDGKGTRAEGAITQVNKKRVEATVHSRQMLPPPAVEITLIQAMCKPDRFDMILQKATELGVSAIQPVITQNCSLPAGKMKKMAERGESIIRNAAQQCETAWIPTFLPLEKLPTLLPSLESFDAVFVGSLHPNAVPFKQSLQKMDSLRRVALVIGPEGDLTEEEVMTTVAAGATPVTFGSQILRTETAAIFGLSVLGYELC